MQALIRFDFGELRQSRYGNPQPKKTICVDTDEDRDYIIDPHLQIMPAGALASRRGPGTQRRSGMSSGPFDLVPVSGPRRDR